MNGDDMKNIQSHKVCQKCKVDIGGKSHYGIQLDCIYDGSSLTACEKVVLCSGCYKTLKSWLDLFRKSGESWVRAAALTFY